MRKRKSIGSDPLDWIAESGTTSKSEAGQKTTSPQEDRETVMPSEAENGSSPDSGAGILPLASNPTIALERQLLLVDGILREGGAPRPRLNQVLLLVLFLLTVLGMGILFFQEVRRQWTKQIVSLEGTVERIEKEKGRNERMLEHLILEKDGLIRDKEGTLMRIESLHQTVVEELRLARSENRRLREENQTLKENPSSRKSPVKPLKSTAVGPDEGKDKSTSN